MRVKKPLRHNSELEAVFEDVQKRYEKRLPVGWQALVYFACYPQILSDPDVLAFDDNRQKVDALHYCLGEDIDLALEIMADARRYCVGYDPMKCKTQAGRVRAVLLRSWRARLINKNNEWHSPTKQESKQMLFGNKAKGVKRLKSEEVRRLQDNEIASWLIREYGFDVKTESVKAARQSLSKSKSNGKI